VAPIFAMSFLAMGIGFGVGEVAPRFNAIREQLLKGKNESIENERYNFAFASATGRNYRVYTLNVQKALLEHVEIETRRSTHQAGVLVSAEKGNWKAKRGWALQKGILHIMHNDSTDIAIGFDSLYDRALQETPAELRASEKAPAAMNFRQLSRFIVALERSGADVNLLKVERTLKLAIPVTCVIIALFGAPLATSSQRGGAAYGVAVSLGTTITFLILIQLTRAIGGHGLISADLAGWLPNIIVGTLAVILLARVRT
ncbi:MAG: LptF/LptG family permease, partial [Gemmatimonadaceae bacterium]